MPYPHASLSHKRISSMPGKYRTGASAAKQKIPYQFITISRIIAMVYDTIVSYRKPL
jgi:hypothetical protein